MRVHCVQQPREHETNNVERNHPAIDVCSTLWTENKNIVAAFFFRQEQGPLDAYDAKCKLLQLTGRRVLLLLLLLLLPLL